ncbi:hypothetical protein B0S90_0335 [Caldicellulosiruptor bescii]|uniref:Uncharacterized protein n=2 Tax=Caldicellulosiruptor bescii TaxID=31899 RepID=B9MLM1_CALBD|nr:hypothetical protein [Caldicellulosiruptor bescii]ACM59229.1 hypothetical protein Athe_0067 [Caldicellulosiruptor bescii DSM 6725]PBC88313.1 hypothetical protein B0S87_1290 [Caldicellulosiruptor bescii]PBC92206.1 hypothetical protein B0S89_2703 [Caldicellulosiruptor bescii]PBD04984.1 hypothetical protein B0S85_2704 [Caldicellulosiruptor bescii]PBD05385.1 hypothetical protein B0S90_0335 [Caldicellulosiruptor bescii]
MKSFLVKRIVLLIFFLFFLVNVFVSAKDESIHEKIYFFNLYSNSIYFLRTVANIQGDAFWGVDIKDSIKGKYTSKFQYPDIEIAIVCSQRLFNGLRFISLKTEDGKEFKIRDVKLLVKKPFVNSANYYLFAIYLPSNEIPKGTFIFEKLKCSIKGKIYEVNALKCYVDVQKAKTYDWKMTELRSGLRFNEKGESLEDVLSDDRKKYIGDETICTIKNVSSKKIKILKIEVPEEVYPSVSVSVLSNKSLIKPDEEIKIRIFVPKEYAQEYHIITVSPKIVYKYEDDNKSYRVSHPLSFTDNKTPVYPIEKPQCFFMKACRINVH